MNFKLWLETDLPDWWNELSQNPFAQGWKNGDLIMDWLKRHNVQSKDGKYIFYHGTPKTNNFKVLRAGSYLVTNPESAIFFAKRDRNLKEQDIKVLIVKVFPWEIYVGQWATLRDDVKITSGI